MFETPSHENNANKETAKSDTERNERIELTLEEQVEQCVANVTNKSKQIYDKLNKLTEKLGDAQEDLEGRIAQLKKRTKLLHSLALAALAVVAYDVHDVSAQHQETAPPKPPTTEKTNQTQSELSKYQEQFCNQAANFTDKVIKKRAFNAMAKASTIETKISLAKDESRSVEDDLPDVGSGDVYVKPGLQTTVGMSMLDESLDVSVTFSRDDFVEADENPKITIDTSIEKLAAALNNQYQ
ncbi:MAG: hypothetical protein BRC25_01420 [Parcubacteria group bacterium SW_6_46_9]|nr:MAG: hypothetical protein BRC25_01420 [Parcubacteria group bacterium SW_6_46_9]